MTETVAWVGFVLALLELLLIGFLIFAAARLWRVLRPQLEPLLVLLAPPPAGRSKLVESWTIPSDALDPERTPDE